MKELEALSERTVSEIRLLSEIAKLNGSRVSIRDISTLTSTVLSEDKLREVWGTSRALSSEFELRDGFVAEKWNEREANSDFESSIDDLKKRTDEYVSTANRFVRWLRDKNTRMLCVSGSTSYGSPLNNDDLDLFVTSSRDSLWIFLLKAMLFARIYRTLHSKAPRICFSYAADDSYVKKAFATHDPLLARDALNLQPLKGSKFLGYLLHTNSWMARYFPRLYRKKMETFGQSCDALETQGFSSIALRPLNLFLFFCVSLYIRTKSRLLNRTYLHHGKTTSSFVVRTGPDHCMFESKRYSILRDLYRQLGATIVANKTDSAGNKS